MMMETYRGEALAWEADDLGHINMRYYIERTEQARVQFFAALGLSRVFQTGAFSTLISTHYHIKYHSEVTPGYGVWVQSGITALGDTDITLEHRLYKTPGTLSATIVESLSHISARTRKAFPWPKRVVDNAKAYTGKLSKEASPRNIDLKVKPGTPSLKRAGELGLPVIGRGTFQPCECDGFGAVCPHVFFGRVSDSVQHLVDAWPDVDFQDDTPLSGALLEARCVIRKAPKAGDCYVVCSGLMDANEHVRKICHWMLDAVSGECIMTFVGVGCLFDLDKRKLVKASPAWVKTLRGSVVDGLSL